MSDHIESLRLQAYLGGELSRDDSALVEAHCRQCEACDRELNELRAMRDLLAEATPAEGPLRPVWPELVHQLRGRPEARLGKAFGLVTAAACTAGIAIGMTLGPGGPGPAATDSAGLSTIASLWSGGETASLLDVYLSSNPEGEGE